MYCILINRNMDLWTVFRQLNKIEGPKFFLDSSLNNPDTGRYSYIGIRPNALLRSRGEIIEYQEGGRWSSWKGDPLAALQKVLNKGKSRRLQTKIPAPFCGGLVGYMGYDMGRNLEKIPHIATNDLMMYEQYWGIYDCILVMDHFQRQLWITANDLQKAKELHQTIEASINACHDKEDEDTWIGELSSNFSRETYTQTVKNIKERVRQGDVYQVNLSQRFTFPLEGSSLGIYKILRRINPAPFAAVLSFDEYEILSMSPERFLRIEDRIIETRPIKGTRPRGINKRQDRIMIEELLRSEKERAELLMIVDLQRNDLGRLCNPGSIMVSKLFAIKKYATVIHQEANVYGILRENTSMEEILRCTFPGGSITGAPKIMAMKIIEESEPHRRGVYTGSIGYIDFTGNCDLNIAIRTIVVKDKNAYYHAGGGIVADSDPALEYQETLDKTKVLFLAREELLRYKSLL